jgi:hypothetical protein
MTTMLDHNCNGKRPCAEPDAESTCPTCNAPIEGVSTTGPSTHTLDPCGHEVGPMTARHLAEGGRRAITDGGRDVHADCDICGRTRPDVEATDLALFDEPVDACQFCRRTYRTDADTCLNCGGAHDGNHIAIDGPSGEADREADVEGYVCDDCCHDLIDRIVAGGSAADAVDTDADDEAVATDGGERR